MRPHPLFKAFIGAALGGPYESAGSKSEGPKGRKKGKSPKSGQ
jgi:hypothetical protein